MQTAADYRKHAQDCIDLAEGKSIVERASLLELARQWLQLADEADFQDAFTSAPDAIVAPSTETKQ